MAAMPVDAGHDLTNFDEVWDLMAATEVPLAWRIGLQAPFQARRVRARASGEPGARALMLYSPTDAWRQVEVARGPEAEVLALLKGLQREADGIVWDDDLPAVAANAQALEAAGFAQVVRQEFLQDLAKVPLEPPSVEGFSVEPLEPAAWPEVRQIYTDTHLATAATAFYTTWPKPPTVVSCGEAFDEMMSAREGPLVPGATVVVRAGGRVAGFVVCAAGKQPGEAMLMDLGVSREAQGRGLSRLLVRWAQRALKRAGFVHMRFYTTDGNLPVLKLFTAEELVDSQVFRVRLWRGATHV